MDNKKDDNYYVKKIIDNINAIINYTKELSYEEFVSKPEKIDASLFRLVQIAENMTHLSKNYKLLHNNTKWGQISGFRNGIVHDYGKTDYFIVYEIISSDIYKLKNDLEKDYCLIME